MERYENDLMEQLMRTSGLLHRYQMFNLRCFGPQGNPHRGQGRVLSILKMKPEISQKELGYLLDMRNQSLGELLNKLEKNGYITRTPSEEDRRTAVIRLTPEGEAAAGDPTVAAEEDLFSSFSEEERKNLSDYLDRIIAALEKRFEDAGEGFGWGPGRFGGHRPPDAPPHGPHCGCAGSDREDARPFGHQFGGMFGRRPCPRPNCDKSPKDSGDGE